MDLPVDDAGDDPLAPRIDAVAGGRGLSGTDQTDLSVGNRNEAVCDDGVGGDDVTADYEVKISHAINLLIF